MDVDNIHRLVTSYGPIAVLVGSTLDNTGIPIFFVIGMGAAHSLGIEPQKLLVAAIIGSIVGDVGTYAIGRYFLTKERILLGRIGQSFKPILDVGHKAMQQWGILTIVFGRFLPYIGKVTPLLAGSYRLSWFRTTAAICGGSIVLMSIMYIYADSVFKVVSGNPSLVKIISAVIGTGLLVVLYCANNALKKRGTMSIQ